MSRNIVSVIGLTLILAAPAAAQSPDDAGVFFDEPGTQTTRTVQTGEFFEFYIVVFDPQPMLAWEAFAVADIFNSPNVAGLTIVGVFDNGPDPLDLDAVVAFSECLEVTGSFWLRRYTAVYFSQVGTDDLYCLEPSGVSSFDPPTPGYLTCSDDLVAMSMAVNGQGIYPDGCAVVNPTQEAPVAAAAPSWGALKATFGG